MTERMFSRSKADSVFWRSSQSGNRIMSKKVLECPHKLNCTFRTYI